MEILSTQNLWTYNAKEFQLSLKLFVVFYKASYLTKLLSFLHMDSHVFLNVIIPISDHATISSRARTFVLRTNKVTETDTWHEKSTYFCI